MSVITEVAVKERPILFRGEMVRAILEGRKTQTRRVMKPQPLSRVTDWVWQRAEDHGLTWLKSVLPDPTRFAEYSPYGKTGERLWVRETWAAFHQTSVEYDEWDEIEGVIREQDQDRRNIVFAADNKSRPEKWRPSIFMPRWACRLELEIMSVRVERLQDITPFDVLQEGVKVCANSSEGDSTAIQNWKELWQRVHANENTWEENPWLWVIEFKRVKP